MPVDITPIGNDNGVHPDDLRVTLDGLDGRYRAADLYVRYTTAAREAGREPASMVKLSRALQEAGAVKARGTGGTRTYVIHPTPTTPDRRTPRTGH